MELGVLISYVSELQSFRSRSDILVSGFHNLMVCRYVNHQAVETTWNDQGFLELDFFHQTGLDDGRTRGTHCVVTRGFF